MSDLRTAAQQALEAMTSSQDLLGTMYLKMDAITALRAALEQPEQDVPETDCGNIEPVAWMSPASEPMIGKADENGSAYHIITTSKKTTNNSVPLYTHQPRREWQGLTDTERAAVQHESFKRGLSPLEFMELHEAKLKEKNHE